MKTLKVVHIKKILKKKKTQLGAGSLSSSPCGPLLRAAFSMSPCLSQGKRSERARAQGGLVMCSQIPSCLLDAVGHREHSWQIMEGDSTSCELLEVEILGGHLQASYHGVNLGKCVCVYIYIYIYTHTHTHTNTYIYVYNLFIENYKTWLRKRRKQVPHNPSEIQAEIFVCTNLQFI